MQAKKIEALTLAALVATGAALAQESVPAKPDYLGLARAYAEAMIDQGRDTYGPEHTPLFAAALDRKAMKLGTAAQFGAIPGVRDHDRMLGGANPQHDMELYELLYELTAITGEKRYAEAADQALGYFFNHCQSPTTGLMAWGEHIYWDFEKEAAAWVRNDEHEVMGEWPFWDACYRLAPEASWNFALGQWDHQVADKNSGDFCRHAHYARHAPGRGNDFPRYAGQMIAVWADAYVRPENAERDRRAEMLNAIAAVVGRMEQNEKMSPSGHLPAHHGKDYVWPSSNLELNRCLWPAAARIEKADPVLAERMRSLALRQDAKFLVAPHTVGAGGGFADTLHTVTGEPRSRAENRPYTEAWSTGYGQGTHAGLANLCFARYRQIEASHPELAAGYRKLLLAAADQYLTAKLPADALLKPDAFAEAIELLLNAQALTADGRYRERADQLGQTAVGLFLADGLPLPKASNRHDHYETITGGPKLMARLLKIMDTKVRSELNAGAQHGEEGPAHRELRRKLDRRLGIPTARCGLAAEKRGELDLGDGSVVERWLYTAEPGSRIPANLYRPKRVEGRIPAIVLTCGHGDSKSLAHMQYVARTFARAGMACLLADPVGEEERHPQGNLGIREHDAEWVVKATQRAGRPVMGKLVFDAMRGLDFLETREWVDPERLGVAGNSLGGAVAG